MSIAYAMIIIAVLLLVLIAAALLLIGRFVWRDAKLRNMNAAAWTITALFLPAFIGLGLYLIARIGHSPLHCPTCGKTVQENFSRCPYCGEELKLCCPSCGAPVEEGWKICPHCAAPLPERRAPVKAKTEKGLGWILALCILLPVLLIGGMLLFSLAPIGYNGHSSAQVGLMPVEEFFEEEPALKEEKPLSDWVNDCMEKGETCAVIWQKVYGSSGGKQYQKLIAYVYMDGYRDADLQSGTGVNFWGNVGLDLSFSGTPDKAEGPMLGYAQVKADKVGKLTAALNGEEDAVSVTQNGTETLLPDYFDMPRIAGE